MTAPIDPKAGERVEEIEPIRFRLAQIEKHHSERDRNSTERDAIKLLALLDATARRVEALEGLLRVMEKVSNRLESDDPIYPSDTVLRAEIDAALQAAREGA